MGLQTRSSSMLFSNFIPKIAVIAKPNIIIAICQYPNIAIIMIIKTWFNPIQAWIINLAYFHSVYIRTVSFWRLQGQSWQFFFKSVMTDRNMEARYFLKRVLKFWSLKNFASHSWNIKWQKCAGMGLNCFIFEKISEN